MSIAPKSVTLGLMAKYWDTSRVKTRLGQKIGMAHAASLHRLFVIYLCQTLSSFEGQRVVCLSPASRCELFRAQLRLEGLDGRWSVVPQAEGDLGNRILQWFDRSFQDAHHAAEHVILIGADCPLLSCDLIEQAHRRLSSHDVVLGPAIDGGYYLIGISAPWQIQRFESLFEAIPWSTDVVLDRTRERLAQQGLSWYELEYREDIDTMAELNRLLDQLRAPPSNPNDRETSRRQLGLLRAMEQILGDVDDLSYRATW